MYEYKYFQAPAPSGSPRNAKAPDLTNREIDLMTGNGWEFVGIEERPVAQRGWFGLRREVQKCFMVFRRNRDPKSHVAALACPDRLPAVLPRDEPAVLPRRVRVLNAGDGFRPGRPDQRFPLALPAE